MSQIRTLETSKPNHSTIAEQQLSSDYPKSQAIATQQFLSFSLPPDGQAVLPTEQTREILNLAPSQITPVAGVPASVMGVCNWRGEILWLADLALLMGKEPLFQQSFRPSHYSALVVRHQNYVVGFVVHQINQIHPYDRSEVLLVAAKQVSRKQPPCLKGYWISPEGETFWVLNGEALVKFFHQEESAKVERLVS